MRKECSPYIPLFFSIISTHCASSFCRKYKWMESIKRKCIDIDDFFLTTYNFYIFYAEEYSLRKIFFIYI